MSRTSRDTNNSLAVSKAAELAKLNAELGIDTWTDEEVAKDVADAESFDSAGRYFGKFVEGRNVLRIGPARKGAKSPFRIVFIHFVDIPGEKNSARFVCPQMETNGARKCGTCKDAARLMASSSPVDQKRGGKLQPQKRALVNAINRELQAKNGDPAWQIAEVGKKLLADCLKFRETTKGLGVDFTHPVHGRDVVVIRVGTGPNDTEYTPNLDPNGQSPLIAGATTAQLAEFLSTMHDLEAEAMPMSDTDIQRVLNGEKVQRGGTNPTAVTVKPAHAGPTAAHRLTPAQEAELDALDD